MERVVFIAGVLQHILAQSSIKFRIDKMIIKISSKINMQNRVPYQVNLIVLGLEIRLALNCELGRHLGGGPSQFVQWHDPPC